MGHHKAAAEYIERAIRQHGGMVAYHSNLGAVYLAWGKPSDAIACFRRALKLQPNYPDAHHNLGVAMRDTGDLERAEDCFRRAVVLSLLYRGPQQPR